MASRSLPAHNGPPPSKPSSSNPPNQTLYLTNLPPRLRKPDLRLSLYTLFSTYGPVLAVVALRTAKMREQAFVAFRSVGDASAAMRAEGGRMFFGRELKIQYAKSKSDAIAKLDGTYRLPSTVAAPAIASTSLQQAIFNAPPGAAAPAPGVKADAGAGAAKGEGERMGSEGPQGVKRAREESEGEDEDEDGGKPMEEESDVEMEASSEESE